MISFGDMGLSEGVLQAVINMGFEEPTPIQLQTIPLAMEGRDLVGRAQTGTGKTVAFAIPMAEKISGDTDGVKGLVITPTRELAVQVAEELNKIGQFKGVRTLPIYGGQDIERQIRALAKRPQIVVGTPGRLMDHMRRRTLRMAHIETVVLDEADEMLNMGFIEDIESILGQIPEERQTMLFSATISAQIKNLANRFLKDPVFVTIQAKEVTVPTIRQSYFEVGEYNKFDALCRLLDIQSPDLAIVFARTKRRVDEIAEGLSKRGYSAEGIHSDLTQSRRDSVMRQFREGTIDILVATDVASRGLDITGVSHVYNFDIPQDPESYVHRIGRTGRMGKTGEAITFVKPREIAYLRTIEALTRRPIARRPLPSLMEVVRGHQRQAVERLTQTADSEDLSSFKGMAENLLEEHDSVALVSAALRLLTKLPDQTPVYLTEERQYQPRAPKPRPRDIGYPGKSDRRSPKSSRDPNRASRKGRKER
ncbi:MAG: DEAD/DEAH box helicase [Syntrophomonadaceae bacterium]|nr:DEAD/DEAH box helicase [Syntrophomonadaceae bacterium]